jgi:hypothetical protein
MGRYGKMENCSPKNWGGLAPPTPHKINKKKVFVSKKRLKCQKKVKK